MTYRPFTLEGNFAFAAGVQEMLIQSHTGVVRLFPAIPGDWKEVSFNKLRTEGAFLVSAKMKKGKVEEVLIFSEKGEKLNMANPFAGGKFKCSSVYKISNDIIGIETIPGQRIRFSGSDN
jgi:alpha-L-fucosidase 2